MEHPTLVLVHGSWHSPEHFGPLTQNLESHSYKCAAVALPSTQTEDTPPVNLSDDIAAVRKVVLEELKTSNVLVVCHSYGGCPTNNALQGLDTASRKQGGASTAVVGIVFLCAILFPAGGSFISHFGGKPAPLHDLRGEFCYVNAPGPEHYFYNDLPAEEAAKWSSMLRAQAWPAYTEPMAYAAHKDFPCAYLFAKQDNALLLAWQQGIVEGVKADGGRIEMTETLESSHSPFLSKVEETGAFIRKAAEKFGAQ